MKVIYKKKFNSRKIFFILSTLLFVTVLSTTVVEGESNIIVTLIKIEDEYEVINKYDFFVHEVDAVCQCSCTNDYQERCSGERDCFRLFNSTTTCTNHIIIDTDSSVCIKFYKLCCQVYFTKTKWTKPYRALNLKYHQTFLTFQITSILHDGKLSAYNVTITKNVKNLILSHDQVLRVREFNFIPHIPDGWYFIEDGSNELQYTDAINAKDEQDINKIGWFQYNDRKKELAGVIGLVLEKYFQVNLLDCHSNPPKYEWKLNATHYIRKGALYLVKKVQKKSDMLKDISSISIDLIEGKIKIRATNDSNVNAFLYNVTSYPFSFTSSMQKAVLNLTFTKGSGIFHVEITSPRWTDIFSFSASPPVKIITLPSRNYDSCQVCVFQNGQQLCQIPSFAKDDEKSVETTTEGLKNNSQIVGINNQTFQNESDDQLTTINSISENANNTGLTIAWLLLWCLVTLILGYCSKIIQGKCENKNVFTSGNPNDESGWELEWDFHFDGNTD